MTKIINLQNLKYQILQLKIRKTKIMNLENQGKQNYESKVEHIFSIHLLLLGVQSVSQRCYTYQIPTGATGTEAYFLYIFSIKVRRIPG